MASDARRRVPVPRRLKVRWRRPARRQLKARRQKPAQQWLKAAAARGEAAARASGGSRRSGGASRRRRGEPAAAGTARTRLGPGGRDGEPAVNDPEQGRSSSQPQARGRGARAVAGGRGVWRARESWPGAGEPEAAGGAGPRRPGGLARRGYGGCGGLKRGRACVCVLERSRRTGNERDGEPPERGRSAVETRRSAVVSGNRVCLHILRLGWLLSRESTSDLTSRR